MTANTSQPDSRDTTEPTPVDEASTPWKEINDLKIRLAALERLVDVLWEERD